MYFIDRSKIEQILIYMEEIIKELEKNSYESIMEKLALERMSQVFIESVLDVGNMMIDGFIMRDPGSYDDIIDILIDEKVLPAEEESSYKEIIKLRKVIVNDYTSINHDELHKTIMAEKNVMEKFSSHIRNYLNNELGVANAFSNE
ncbi:hypothetical protein CIL03_09735 [Virgibacillus indicus]|uniref:DUF86 domain-containing protein n=1 Tax=Virgibacillus indicus TaxID=2024554 RepID=A0A265N9A3_9BACI|nr:DUF86 domain-containing protein [Virgibacillus indicus]OZU88573.1 hypothetical protein CIL03_09735 [Virgibacillus indicus]